MIENTIYSNIIAAMVADSGAGGVNTLVSGRIYDNVPEGTVYPNVQVEQEDFEDNTKTQYGDRIAIQIHIWSRYRGRKEAAIIAARVRTIFDKIPTAISSVSAKCIVLSFVSQNIFTDADGITRHGVVRFTAYAQPR